MTFVTFTLVVSCGG